MSDTYKETIISTLNNFAPFIIFLCLFIIVMKRERRTIMTGILFVAALASLFFALHYLSFRYSKTIDAVLPFAATVSSLSKVIMAIIGLVPTAMIAITLWYGITVIRKEGVKTQNAKTLLFAMIMIIYIVIWPVIGGLRLGFLWDALYSIATYAVVYFILLKSMYTTTSIINLIHRGIPDDADYLILMGAGLEGDKAEILMEKRIDKLYEIWEKNPTAKVVVTGGWSKSEQTVTPGEAAVKLEEKGVPADMIMVDEESLSTVEDIRAARRLIESDLQINESERISYSHADEQSRLSRLSDKRAIKRKRRAIKKEKKRSVLNSRKGPRIILVTSNYHVLRALIVSKMEKIKNVGYGASVRIDYRMNAFVNEYYKYLKVSKRNHIIILGILAVLTCILIIMLYIHFDGSYLAYMRRKR